MRILIIGSKGFIGSYLYNFFLKNKKYKVFSCDVVADYTTSNYYRIDATNSDFKDIFRKNNFDICINASGAANVQDSIKSPLRDYYLNTINVFNILNAIKENNNKCKFLNLSSAAVYGHPSKLPVLENQDLKPISPYGLHKKMSEEICKEFYDFFNIATCSLRIFSAYGDGLKKQLFWDLYNKIKNTNKKVELFGSGNESRDFIYISDLVKVIDIIINNAYFKAEVINVANGTETLIKDAVNIFVNIIDSDKEVVFNGKEKKGDPKNWVADISKIQNMGFKPEITLEKGLLKYYEWIKKERL